MVTTTTTTKAALIKLALPDGNVVAAKFHGYWDMRDIGHGTPACVSRWNGRAWTTGPLHVGEQILGCVPSFAEWKEQVCQ